MVAVVNREIQRLLAHAAILLPTLIGRPDARITVRDLTTGYRLFDHTFDPAAADGQVTQLPPDSFGDHAPPFPVGGGPLRFYTLTARPGLSLALGPGLEAEGTASSLTGRGEAGAADAGVQVVLLGLDDSAQATADSQPDGSFTVTAAAVPGHRYVLAVSAEVSVQEPLEIAFNEALDHALLGITVFDVSGATGSIHPATPKPLDGYQRIRIQADRGWLAGRTYELRLAPELEDAQRNKWNKELRLRFRIAKSAILSGLALERVRDVARVGSLLLVAAERQGLVVVDASNPGALKNFVTNEVGETATASPSRPAVR